jgi:preprotein translocase subunit SecD
MDWEDDDEKKEGEDLENESQSSNKIDQDSDNDKRKVKTPKQKLKELILSSYTNIKSSIKNNNYKQIQETLDKILKNTDKFFSILGQKEMPILLLELFVIVDEATNISKEEQKKLSKEQNVSFHNIKKSINKNKKFEDLIKKYKENRPTEDDLKKEQENFIEKNVNKSETSSHISDSEEDEIDIIELMKKD